MQMGHGEQVHEDAHSVTVHHFLDIFLRVNKRVTGQDGSVGSMKKQCRVVLSFSFTYLVENEFVKEEDESVSFQFVRAL